MRTPKPPEIDVGEVVTEVAALLRSGASTPEAWAQTLAQHPADSPWAAAGQQIAAGTSVDAALRDLASVVKYSGALLVAAAGCCLATEWGSSAADVLDGCVETVTELQNAASERQAAFAGSRATMRMLLALPLCALCLFQGAGINGIGTLISTPIGWACLAIGAAFLTLGHRWVQKLISAAERAGTSP